MIKAGITGGIGSGKSTVCRIFGSMGVNVYDSDARAKTIMDTDPQVIEALFRLFGPQAYLDSGVNRPYIASVVFTDERMMAKLNAIVHPAVFRDFERWFESSEVKHSDAGYALLESAILIEASWHERMDKVIVVTAPQALRIERVMKRNGLPYEMVKMRVNAQTGEEERLKYADYRIVADEKQLVVPQVEELHDILSRLTLPPIR